LNPYCQNKLYDIALNRKIIGFPIGTAINYTTNAIGNRFLIAKGYKSFHVKQGVSRVELARRWENAER
jgi:hypothetical protein